MKKQIFVLLFLVCFILSCVSCSSADGTHIHFSIRADATNVDGTDFPAIRRDISFPKTAVEKKTVLFFILYACDTLGYEYERDGKYHEILTSVAGRRNLPDYGWVIQAADKSGKPITATTDTEIGDIAYLTITYQALA
jgi:hypothetical protein